MKAVILNLGIVFTISASLIATIASKVEIHADPNVVIDSLSRSLTVRCDVLGVKSASTSVVGRDVSMTSDDLQKVYNITLVKNGTVVAVMIYEASGGQRILQSSPDATVNGTLFASSIGHSYLEFTVQNPTKDHAGDYVCDVYGQDTAGKGVSLSTRIGVDVSTPSVMDLVKYIHQLEKERVQKEQKIDSVVNHVNQLEDSLANKEQQMTSLVNQVDQLQNSLAQKDKEMNSMSSQLYQLQNTLADKEQILKHSESGVIHCGNSNGQNSPWNGQNNRDITVQFSKPYPSPPAVQIGMTGDITYNGKEESLFVTLRSVTARGFTVRCTRWNNVNVYKMDVNWLSVPH